MLSRFTSYTNTRNPTYDMHCREAGYSRMAQGKPSKTRAYTLCLKRSAWRCSVPTFVLTSHMVASLVLLDVTATTLTWALLRELANQSNTLLFLCFLYMIPSIKFFTSFSFMPLHIVRKTHPNPASHTREDVCGRPSVVDLSRWAVRTASKVRILGENSPESLRSKPIDTQFSFH
jgi:hypothetical protein